MDVQAAAPTTTILSPAFTQITSPLQPAPGTPSSPSSSAAAAASPATVAPATVPAVSGDSGSNSGSANQGTGNSTIGATPGLATLPAGPPDGSKKGSETDTSLASAVGLLYNVQEQNITVSFQIEQNPNEIVTVFTNKQTGKVIVQFPSETMIALAKLFDKLDGSVVNKKV